MAPSTQCALVQAHLTMTVTVIGSFKQRTHRHPSRTLSSPCLPSHDTSIRPAPYQAPLITSSASSTCRTWFDTVSDKARVASVKSALGVDVEYPTEGAVLINVHRRRAFVLEKCLILQCNHNAHVIMPCHLHAAAVLEPACPSNKSRGVI